MEIKTLKPVESLSRFLRVSLIILAIVDGVGILAGIWLVFSYATLPDDAVFEDTFPLSEMVSGGVGIVQSLFTISVMIIFAMWLYRMTFNLRQQSQKHMEMTPGWMIGWYFVPFANLVKPYHGMKELWQVSHRRWDADPQVLRWWWGFWLFANSVSSGASRVLRNADTIESYLFGASTFVVADILGVGLDVLAFSVVAAIWLAYEKNYINYVEEAESSS